MSHHHHGHDQEPNKNLGIAFLLNLGFTLLEIVGGLWTNSVAILSDALHDLGDSVSLGMAYLLDRYAARDYDDRRAAAGPHHGGDRAGR